VKTAWDLQRMIQYATVFDILQGVKANSQIFFKKPNE